jgi:ribokinase
MLDMAVVTPLVLVVGSLSADHTIYVDRLPTAGETVRGYRYQTAPGGKGLNQAVAAARQGAQVAMCCCLGEDDWGRRLLNVLSAEGIGTGFARTAPGVPSGTALITVERSGVNTIVVAAGANGLLSVADVEAARSLLVPGCVLLAQLEVPLDAVEAAFVLAKQAGATTVLNPSPVPDPVPRRLLELADVLVPNEAEALAITGASGPERALNSLRELTQASIALTLGEQGALVAPAGASPVLVPAFRVEPVDTTAAGDAFCGTLAASLVAGASLVEAARRGCAAGALATRVPGAVPSLPTLAAVEQLLAGSAPPAGSAPRRQVEPPAGSAPPASG